MKALPPPLSQHHIFLVFYQSMVSGARGLLGVDVTSPVPMVHACAHVHAQIPPQPMVA